MGNGKQEAQLKGGQGVMGRRERQEREILFPSLSFDHASLVNINRRLRGDWRQKSQGEPIKLLRFSIKHKL